MRISTSVEQIKIVFNITKDIQRYVYVYIIYGQKNCYLIDSGVKGCENIIESYLKKRKRQLENIKAILLTHSHPDHIGGAATIKEKSNCRVYSSIEEKEWIENIDTQFNQRPIPNFYKLVDKSIVIDKTIVDKETLELEPGITIKGMNTPGHSVGSLSFYFIEEQILFVGDAIPIAGDIPIFTNYNDSIKTLEYLNQVSNVKYYCPAWGEMWEQSNGKRKISEAQKYLKQINEFIKSLNETDIDCIYTSFLAAQEFKHLDRNPLLRGSISAILHDL